MIVAVGPSWVNLEIVGRMAAISCSLGSCNSRKSYKKIINASHSINGPLEHNTKNMVMVLVFRSISGWKYLKTIPSHDWGMSLSAPLSMIASSLPHLHNCSLYFSVLIDQQLPIKPTHSLDGILFLFFGIFNILIWTLTVSSIHSPSPFSSPPHQSVLAGLEMWEGITGSSDKAQSSLSPVSLAEGLQQPQPWAVAGLMTSICILEPEARQRDWEPTCMI